LSAVSAAAAIAADQLQLLVADVGREHGAQRTHRFECDRVFWLWHWLEPLKSRPGGTCL
jgi:hypothetical protein